MIRRAFLIVMLLVFIFKFPPVSVRSAEEIALKAKQINYTLPYSGILPDHPLYFLKKSRDRVLIFLTRQQMKKAILYLLLSDKRAQMAIELSNKGKWQLAITTVSEGEVYFMKIPGLIAASKQQGVSPSGDFILQLKLSNEKHREVIENLLRDIPQGERARLESVLLMTGKIHDTLSSL